MSHAKKKNGTRLVIVLVILALVGAGAYFTFRKRDEITLVQSEKALRRNITELVVANGKIQPVVQVVINPEVSGEIVELPVSEGQPVRTGELLVRIKPDNYEAVRNSARASFKSAVAAKTLAQANLKKAEADLQRAKDLAGSRLISEAQLLEAQTSFEVMHASFDTSIHQTEQAAASLAKAEDDLAKTTINAPMDGIVTKLKSQKGERVVGTALMAGTEIMTIADLDAMEARVDISETDVVLIQVGQSTRLEVDAFRDRKFSGKVTEIANAAKGQASGSSSSSSSSQSQQEATKFEVKIRVEEKEAFRPGMSVTAEIETRYRTNVVVVPIQSVTTRLPAKPKDGTAADNRATLVSTANAAGPQEKKEARKPIEVVFLLDGDKVRMAPVRRGISDDSYVEITEGLAEGAEVIAGGYKAINRELEDGKRVKIGEPEEKPEKDEKN